MTFQSGGAPPHCPWEADIDPKQGRFVVVVFVLLTTGTPLRSPRLSSPDGITEHPGAARATPPSLASLGEPDHCAATGSSLEWHRGRKSRAGRLGRPSLRRSASHPNARRLAEPKRRTGVPLRSNVRRPTGDRGDTRPDAYTMGDPTSPMCVWSVCCPLLTDTQFAHDGVNDHADVAF